MRGYELHALTDPEFAPVWAIESVLHRDTRDLSGHEDGTKNSRDEAAIKAAVVKGKGIGIDGSSFAAVQQRLHDVPKFDAMSNAPRRRISSPGLRGAQIDALGGRRGDGAGLSCLRQVVRRLRVAAAAHDRTR